MDDSRVTELVRDAAAAPSMHNAQPWRFRYARSRHAFRLHADFDRVMPHTDPDARALRLGCGAALFNLRVALAHAGRHAKVTLLPDAGDPSLLATVEVTGTGAEDIGPGPLHPAIARRRTSRHPFAETAVPEHLRVALIDAAHREGAVLSFPAGWHLDWVRELADEAEARNLTDGGSAADLARWTRFGPAEARTAADGVPEYAFGPRKHGGKAPVRDFAGGRPAGGLATAPFEDDPHLALLTTEGDRAPDWVRAGQAMERVLLLATLKGLSTSFATQALEWPDLRWSLRDPGSGTGHVQMILRLGYGPECPATPRRPVSDVLEFAP
ncbi:Acg family FMN-binding oxidoreductase [Streptomyces albireticuli]|uniref:Acg family FMN-binding oxidoreductase n=1 Tax=Streptomyces albireticuli TaxID=1940 RepID=UPI000B43A747|nr:nitroreductase [Streptomyces albireticuli]